jgi:hypothetical protein
LPRAIYGRVEITGLFRGSKNCNTKSRDPTLASDYVIAYRFIFLVVKKDKKMLE